MLSMLAALPLLVAVATQNAVQVDVCATEAPDLRIFFAQGGYIAPPEVAKLMIDISDGQTNFAAQDVNLIKRTFKTPDAQHWLDLGLYTAITDGRPDVTEQLIGLGADVNARPEYPLFSSAGTAMVNLGQQMELHKLHIDGKVSETFAKSLEPFPPTIPMLEQAAKCSHVATLKVLLENHADIYPKVGVHQNGSKSGILPHLIINHNEDSIGVLLDHGYDPCRDFQLGSNPKHLTDLALAKRFGLSPKLVQRLADLSARCPNAALSTPTH